MLSLSARPKRLAAAISASATPAGGNIPQNASWRPVSNQRGVVTVQIRSRKAVWIEDLIAIIESSGSSELYALLKRQDEKAVTERAYENPVFVEDLVRNVLGRDFSPFDRSIDTHVCNLRRKLGPLGDGGERIKGVRGAGYLYASPAKPGAR